MKISHHKRQVLAILGFLGLTGIWVAVNPASYETEVIPTTQATHDEVENPAAPLATDLLARLEVKGRAPKTGYKREEFYSGWPNVDGCNLRQRIIRREFGETAVMDENNPCNVVAGSFIEPYTGEYKSFNSRVEIGKGIQIDHIVALSDAWQKGAQYMEKSVRYQIATDPLNLVAADANANMTKSDGDAATWLPPNKSFRCQYVARQVSVKYKYGLSVSEAEKNAIAKVLESCPEERAIGTDMIQYNQDAKDTVD